MIAGPIDKSTDGSSNARHTLSKREALDIMSGVDHYWGSSVIEPHTQDRHRTVVVAEAMERDLKFDLASSAMEVHNLMKSLRDGSNIPSSLQYLKECVIADELTEKARGTKFEEIATKLATPVADIKSVLDAHKSIDWKKSARVLSEIKHKTFPKYDTMVENLDRWQRSKTTNPER